MRKVDVYNHEGRYKNWKEKVLQIGEEGLTKQSSKLLLEYIFDMEIGNNVSNKSKKGARGYHRLNAVRQKISKVIRMLQDRGVKDISKVTEKQLQHLFDDMRKGVLLSDKGERYKSTTDYAKALKSFWHWYQKVQMKKGISVPDITEYIDSSSESKPVWVYLNEQQIKELLQKVNARYAPVLHFLYDSGARVTETLSLVGNDIEAKGNDVYVNIRPEISKSLGRKIKLMLCGKEVVEYIKSNEIKSDGQLFPFNPAYLNRYIGNLSKELFGDGISQGGEKYSNLTLYDLRHNSCCYWLPKYKQESALMYRFGWKTSKYISYYSEFLGMKDTITDEDMMVDITKAELERKVDDMKKIMKEMLGVISANVKENSEKNPDSLVGQYKKLQSIGKMLDKVPKK